MPPVWRGSSGIAARSVLCVSLLVGGVRTAAAQDPVVIARVSPAGDLPPNARIELSFDRPLGSQVEALGDPARLVRLEPAVAARIVWRDPATIRISPDTSLPPGTTITVVVDTFSLPAGARFAARWSRTWRVRPPSMLASLPGLSARGIAGLGVDGRVSLLVRGIPDTAELAARTALVSPATGPACAAWPSGRRIGVRVALRLPRVDDPYPLRQFIAPRDSATVRFDRVVELTPVEALPENCTLDFILAALTPIEGNGTETRYRVRTAPPASLTVGCPLAVDCVAARRIELRSPTTITWTSLRASVRLEPADAFTWPDSGGASAVWSFGHRLRTGDTVRVIVAPGFRDLHGRTVPTPPVFVVPDRRAGWSAPPGPIVVRRGASSTLPVRHVGIDSARVTLSWSAAAPIARLVGAADPSGETTIAWRDSLTYTVPLARSRNEEHLSDVALRLPRAEWRLGLLGVRIEPVGFARRLGGDPPVISRLVQHSDLTAHTRVHASGGAVFVTDARGAPVAGADVRALDIDGRRIGAARTDREGLAQLEARARPARAAVGSWPFPEIAAIEVSRGEDRLLVATSVGGRSGGRTTALRAILGPDAPEYQHAAILPDRDLYRPGEQLHATAVARDGWSDALRAASGERVRWRLTAGSGFGEAGATLATREGTLSVHGVASDSFPLPADGALGQYLLALDRRRAGEWEEVVRHGVQLREFRARELTVAAAFERGEVTRGDTLHATIRASLLLDAPLGDAEVAWVMESRELSAFELPSGVLPQGWSAGDPFTQDFAVRSAARQEGTSRTDSAGESRLAFATDELPRTSGARVTVVASVRDITGQQVTGSASAIIRGSERLILLRPPPGWSRTLGRAERLRVGVVDREGRWIDGVPLRISVIHRRRNVGAGGAGVRVVDDTLQQLSVLSRDSSASFEYVPSRLGELGIVIEGADTDGSPVRSSATRYIVAADPRTDSTSFPASIDRDSARVGETVRLHFESPWADADAWIVVARDRVIQQRRVRARTGDNVVPLRIDPRWIPHATVSVMLVRRDPPAGPVPLHQRYRVKEAAIAVHADSKRLTVRITPRTREVLPGAATSIDIEVRDASGRPVAGEVVLWAVDEGVLALTGQSVPDPLALLLTQRHWPTAPFATTLAAAPDSIRLSPSSLAEARSVSSMRLSSVVVNEDAIDLSGRGVAGGAALSLPTRQRFRTTAFHRSGILLGSSGRATVPVQLPDGITTYRLLAVAVDRRDRFGSGEGSLVATKPLIARAALPRFVRAADRFAAGVAINTRALRLPLPVSVSARASGAVTLSDSAAKRVMLEADGARVDFPASVARSDTARFAFSVTSDSLHDGIAVDLPVREDQAPEARALVAVVRDTATLRLALPPDVDLGRSRLEIRVGASPLPVLRTWTTWLQGERAAFTYTVIFTARSLLAMRRLQANAALALADSAVIRRRLEVAVATLVSRVSPDGRVQLWPGHTSGADWLSADVATILMDARELGVTVPEGALLTLSPAIERRLQVTPLLPDTTYGSAGERGQLIAWHLAERLANVALLARRRVAEGGRPPDGSVDSLASLVRVADRMAFEDRARLARLLPSGEAAQRLLADLWRHAELRGTRIDIPDSVLAPRTHRSQIAPFARLLEATQRHQPDHPMLGALAQRIIQQVSAGGSSPWNGEDYASAVEAIAGFLHTVPATEAAVTLRDVAGRTIDLDRVTDSLVMRTARDESLVVRVETQGAPAYVSVTAHTIRRERPLAPSTQGLRVERWYERVRDGRLVNEVEEGELVRVHLRLSADGAREFVVLEDPLPAGVEIVDPHHRGSGAQQARLLEERREAESAENDPGAWSFRWWRWYPWDHVERRDDRLVIHSRGLSAGVHTYTYLVRATTSGLFVRPQATAREHFDPALEGRSDGGWFTVTARPPRFR